jgi:hypothetical protein
LSQTKIILLKSGILLSQLWPGQFLCHWSQKIFELFTKLQSWYSQTLPVREFLLGREWITQNRHISLPVWDHSTPGLSKHHVHVPNFAFLIPQCQCEITNWIFIVAIYARGILQLLLWELNFVNVPRFELTASCTKVQAIR